MCRQVFVLSRRQSIRQFCHARWHWDLHKTFQRSNRYLSFTASTELSGMTSDQFVSMRHQHDTNLSCRRVHRSTPLLDGLGHDDTGGSQQRPDLGGAPIAPRDTSPRRKYITQVPGSRCRVEVFLSSRVLSTTGGISCRSCRYLFIADIRKVSISEGIVVVNPCPSLSAPQAHWTVEYPPVLKPLC